MAKSAQKAAPAAKTAPAKAPAKSKAAPAAAKTETNEEPTFHDHLLDLARSADKSFLVMNAKEKRDVYLKRLLMTCSDATDENYASLPKPVQKWFEKAAAANNAGETIPQLPGLDDKTVAPATGKKELPLALKAANEARAAKKAAVEASGEKPEKTPRVKKEKAPKEPRGEGKTQVIRVALAQNPEIKLDELTKIVHDQHPDIALTTISTIRSDGSAMIRALKAAGWKAPRVTA